MKTKRKYICLNDYEHRLLVGSLVAARNQYLREGKPIEDINDLIQRFTDAPAKRLCAIKEEA